MVVTEIELRELWRDGRQPLPAFLPGTRFSPAAQDFIKDHQLEIHFATPVVSAAPAPQLPITNYQLPSSSDQLPAALDTLAALTGLVAAESRRYQLTTLAARLDALATYCQQLQAIGPAAPPAPATQLPVTTYQLPFSPGPTDHAILHWLNFLRASARQAAALAAAAGNAPLGAALEQVSASAADLGRRVQGGELGWNSPMV